MSVCAFFPLKTYCHVVAGGIVCFEILSLLPCPVRLSLVSFYLAQCAGAVVTSANPDTLTDASVAATLTAGNYFLRVSGVGRGDILADGYSNYSIIGQYTISGNAP